MKSDSICSLFQTKKAPETAAHNHSLMKYEHIANTFYLFILFFLCIGRYIYFCLVNKCRKRTFILTVPPTYFDSAKNTSTLNTSNSANAKNANA